MLEENMTDRAVQGKTLETDAHDWQRVTAVLTMIGRTHSFRMNGA